MAEYKNAWSKWNGVHRNADQLSRIKSAGLKETTPYSVDQGTRSATFVGSNGEMYATRLDQCDCADFAIRGAQYPCKHMYRLAMEIGVFPASDVQSDHTIPVMRLQRANILDLVENGPFNEAYAVYAFLQSVLRHSVPKAKATPHSLLQGCYLFDPASPDQYKKNNACKKDYVLIRDLMVSRIGSAILNNVEESSIITLMSEVES